jgi:hypothetical protein
MRRCLDKLHHEFLLSTEDTLMTSPANEFIMEGTLAEGPPGYSMNATGSTPPVVNVLASSYDFQPALEEFLAKHPHHELLRDVLGTVCRLTCTACAILCTSILSDQYSINEVIDSLKVEADKQFETAALEGSGTPGCLSQEDTVCIIDYLRAFDYVYQRRRPEEQLDQSALSSLSTIGYLATRRALKRNHPTSLLYTDQILHGLILPLLSNVFQSCTGRGLPSD